MKQENFEIMEVISYASWWNVMIQKLHFRVTIHMISLQTAAFGKSPFVAIHTIVDRHFAKDCFPFLVRKNSISCPKQMWSVGFLLRGGKEIELVKESSDILVLKYISKIIKLHTKPGHLPLKSIQKILQDQQNSLCCCILDELDSSKLIPWKPGYSERRAAQG